jgi:hypothetical protein
MKKELKKEQETLDISGFKKVVDNIIQEDIKEMREGKKKAGVIIISSDGTIRRGSA